MIPKSGFLVFCLVWVAGCARERVSPLVVLVAVDGASPEIVTRLRAEGKLPNLDRLVRAGSFGPMESLAARRRLNPKPRRGYWSPIVWASIATGKVPDKHGIVDFLLPVPGTAFVWAGDNTGPPRSEIRLPELTGKAPLELHVRLRSYPPNGRQDVELFLNGAPLGTVEMTPKWASYTLEIAAGARRPAENRLVLAFSRQRRPSDNGRSNDHRALAGALASVSVTDADGSTVLSFDPVYGRFDLVRGFHLPEAELVEAQSSHLRAAPVWDLLGRRGHPVGVVGYWTTWPAREVNGFVVSSHMGVRGKRQKTTSRLTWPRELADELNSLAPDEEAVARMTRKLYPAECKPLAPEDLRSFEGILWQDMFYQRIAKKLLPTMEQGFFTVYFESIDASGHLFSPLQGGDLPPGCPESVRDVVDETYVQLDAWVGELVHDLPEGTTFMLVSDHGSVPGAERGFHGPFGVFVASGPGIRRGAETRGVSVLDVAPTILYALGEAIPLDMDGKVAVSAFEAGWLDAHPPHYTDVDTAFAPSTFAGTDVSEQMRERLRSLGYLK